jgi:hypothetical protein
MTQNFSQYFRALQILFFALLAGQIGVTILLYVVHTPPTVDASWAQEVTTWLPLLLVLQAGLAFFLSRKKLESARSQPTVEGKLEGYRVASILKWALLEGGTLISVVLFFVLGNITFLYYAGMMIVLFATQFPSRQRLVNDLDISANEQMRLDDPNAMVAQSRRYNLPNSH